MPRDAFELEPIYCRDNPKVQAFVAERVRRFDPYAAPETMRDVFTAAQREFGHWNCFYLEIRPH